MNIERLVLSQFRNYESLDLALHEGTNLFYGDNAQGKTNILEAIFLCGTTKSHRSAKEREMIRFESSEAHVRMDLNKRETPYRIDLQLDRAKKKQYAINSVPVKKAAQLLEIGHYVFFSPEDLKIIKNGPAERRRFMDLQLCQLDPLYIHQLAGYNHVLSQRAALLRSENLSQITDMLDIWDEQLVTFGQQVIKSREKMIESMNLLVKEIHAEMTNEKEKVSVRYEKSVSADEMKEALLRNRDHDMKYKMTGVGPHRDDLLFESNGKDLRKYGSQGQQRTAALSLKLAEIELAKKAGSDAPVLLLDDVLSELDHRRQRALLSRIRSTQTLITGTGMDPFRNTDFKIDRIFYVENGTVEEQ